MKTWEQKLCNMTAEWEDSRDFGDDFYNGETRNNAKKTIAYIPVEEPKNDVWKSIKRGYEYRIERRYRGELKSSIGTHSYRDARRYISEMKIRYGGDYTLRKSVLKK